MPWSRLLNSAIWASGKLPAVGGDAAVRSFVYQPTVNKLVEGYYQRTDRSILVKLPDLDKHPEPQIAFLTVLHEMSHAMLHYDTPRDHRTERYCEVQADLTAITACWLMGYQLPAAAFEYVKSMLYTQSSYKAYHAIIDIDFDYLLLPSAHAIVKAFS
jgi:hypothetical protein